MHFPRSLSLPVPPHPRRPAAGRRPGRIAAGLALGLLAALTLAACATERSERRRFLARIAPPQPLLSASATYANGAIAVQSWLGPSVRLHAPGERPRHPAGRPDHLGERPIEDARPFSQGGSTFSREEIDEMYGHVDYQYMRPPRLALTFTFTNTSSAPITFTIANVDSPLGNYAARPETLTLAPGQQGSPDPMLSPVENNFDRLDVTLTLKVGTTGETHVLPLCQMPAAPPAPPPPGGARPD